MGYVSVNEVAAQMGVSIRRVQQMCKNGEIPGAVEEYYYVDKTLLIRDFLDNRPMVSLFTRPRRFGKTLNMDMLRVFFEKTEKDTSIYFRDKLIWQCGEKYTSYQGKYPVIFLTFKDVKCSTWAETFRQILLRRIKG